MFHDAIIILNYDSIRNKQKSNKYDFCDLIFKNFDLHINKL